MSCRDFPNPSTAAPRISGEGFWRRSVRGAIAALLPLAASASMIDIAFPVPLFKSAMSALMARSLPVDASTRRSAVPPALAAAANASAAKASPSGGKRAQRLETGSHVSALRGCLAQQRHSDPSHQRRLFHCPLTKPPLVLAQSRLRPSAGDGDFDRPAQGRMGSRRSGERFARLAWPPRRAAPARAAPTLVRSMSALRRSTRRA